VVKHIPFLVSFLRWHTEQGYATITHDSVTAYLTEIYATKTKGYATVIRSYLRSFCHYLQTQGIIGEIAFDYKPDKEKEEDPFKLHGVYNYYRYLGVSKTADLAEIKKAYHNKARSLHPDVNQDDPNATNRVMALNKVYDTLKNDQDRLAYDVTMGYVTYDDDYLDSLDLTWHEKEFYFIRI
jgi:DnaJ-domain-containing protein 1